METMLRPTDGGTRDPGPQQAPAPAQPAPAAAPSATVGTPAPGGRAEAARGRAAAAQPLAGRSRSSVCLVFGVARRAAAVPRLAGQRPGRRQHRAAGAGAEHPVLAAPRRRAGHQRVPRAAAWSRRAAGGVRRGDRRRAPRRSPTRPRRSRPTARRWPRSTAGHRRTPARSPRPGTTTGRASRSAREYLRRPSARPARPRRSPIARGSWSSANTDARRGRDGRRSTRLAALGSASLALAALWWSTVRSPGASTAGSTSGSRPPRSGRRADRASPSASPAPVRRQRRAASTAATRTPSTGPRRTAGQRRQGQREPAADQARLRRRRTRTPGCRRPARSWTTATA